MLPKSFRYTLLSILFLLIGLEMRLNAQELDAEVRVVGQKVTGVDPSIFVNMQRGLEELLSTTSWTDKEISEDTKISCSFILTIEEVKKNNIYRANLQVQASRPVFKSSYSTTLLNHRDKEIVFTYIPNVPFQYNKGGKNENNLVAIISYYAHLIIGLEADSFSKYGGSEYLKEAQNIVARQTGEGWDSSERTSNRYWIIEDYRDLKGLREIFYNYHRKGLDLMVDEPRDAVNTIADNLLALEKTFIKSSTQVALHLFFDAKAREISNSMKALEDDKKKKLLTVLEKVDPGHINVYKVLEK